MCRDRYSSGERRKPVSSEPGIKAIWKMRRGVGNRNVLMYGVVRGHSCDYAVSKWATTESEYEDEI